MNELIKELAEQADDFTDDKIQMQGEYHPDWHDIRDQKFAELIVREMLQTCEDHPAWTGRMIGEKIKQHFGIVRLNDE